MRLEVLNVDLLSAEEAKVLLKLAFKGQLIVAEATPKKEYIPSKRKFITAQDEEIIRNTLDKPLKVVAKMIGITSQAAICKRRKALGLKRISKSEQFKSQKRKHKISGYNLFLKMRIKQLMAQGLSYMEANKKAVADYVSGKRTEEKPKEMFKISEKYLKLLAQLRETEINARNYDFFKSVTQGGMSWEDFKGLVILHAEQIERELKFSGKIKIVNDVIKLV